MASDNRKVVVTGMGIASAIGCSVKEFWERLIAGESGVDLIRTFDVSEYTTQIGAEIKGFPPEGYFRPKTAARLSRVSLLGVYAAQEALKDAGLAGREPGQPIGVIVGSSQGGFVEGESFFKMYFTEEKLSAFAISKSMVSAPAAYISITCDLRGPLMTIDTACSSANHAIGTATALIQSGQIEMAVAGGADTVFSPVVFNSWCAMRAMSVKNETPKEACRPFSKDRDGTVLGEGAAMVVLESEESAKKRGVPILAEVLGYGSSSDAHSITNPNVEGPTAAIKNALRNAGIAPEEVSYVNAHATATVANDLVETKAIKQALGEHAREIPISGIKAAVGHTLAASAAIEVVACVLAMRDNLIPPTLNYSEPDPDCDLDYVTEGAREAEVRICLSNSFGFGGSNAVLALKRYEGG